jgi:hypothetical protein
MGPLFGKGDAAVVVPVASHDRSHTPDRGGRHSQGFINLNPDTLSHFETSYYDDNFMPDDAILYDNGKGSDEDAEMASYAMHTSTLGDVQALAHGAGGAGHTRPMGQLPPLSGVGDERAMHPSLSAAPSPLRSPTDARYWRAVPDAGSPDARPKSDRQV